MVIDARHIFACAHTFVSVKEAGVLMFVCATCEYRTELLPLRAASEFRASGKTPVPIGVNPLPAEAKALPRKRTV